MKLKFEIIKEHNNLEKLSFGGIVTLLIINLPEILNGIANIILANK